MKRVLNELPKISGERKMIYECCSKDKVRFEIESWYQNLKSNEKIFIEIKKCPVLKGTYDLRISLCKNEMEKL